MVPKTSFSYILHALGLPKTWQIDNFIISEKLKSIHAWLPNFNPCCQNLIPAANKLISIHNTIILCIFYSSIKIMVEACSKMKYLTFSKHIVYCEMIYNWHQNLWLHYIQPSCGMRQEVWNAQDYEKVVIYEINEHNAQHIMPEVMWSPKQSMKLKRVGRP